MKKLNYAIIGCGAAGKVHAYHFSKNLRINCIAAVDIDCKNAEYYQRHFGFKKLYLNYTEMLENEKIDLISIATPPGAHLEQIQEAAQKKIPIFCEKPLVISESQIVDLENIIKNHKIKLGVMLPRRYYNNTLAVKKVIENNLLGDIQEIKFDLKCYKDYYYYKTWRGNKKMAGGGVLMSQSLHSIDQLIYLFGEPSAVEGIIRTTRNYIEIEDEAEATIYFKNGYNAKIAVTVNAENTLWQGITEVTGTKGKIVLNSEKVITWDISNCVPPYPEEKEDIPEKYKPRYYGPGHLKVINDFITEIYSGNTPRVTALDSLTSLKLILAIYDSSISGKKIFL